MSSVYESSHEYHMRVKNTFESICTGFLEDMFARDVENATLEAFKKVEYTPSKNIKSSFDKAWYNSSSSDSLGEFVYRVWRIDS